MKRRPLARERCLSTDAIVRERLAGGEDAFLETLFGPFLLVPKNWRGRFADGCWPTDLARRDRALKAWREREEARERAREEAQKLARAEFAALQAEREAEERRRYPFKSVDAYTCPRCGRRQYDPETNPQPRFGDFIQCVGCLQVLQFQPWGMHPYEWRWVSTIVPEHVRQSFKAPRNL